MKVCTNLELLTDQCSLRFLWINWYWMTANWFCIMSVTYCLMLRCSVFHYMCFMKAGNYIQTLLHRQYQQGYPCISLSEAIFFFIHMFKEVVYFIKYDDHWCGKQISVKNMLKILNVLIKIWHVSCTIIHV